MTKSTFQFVVGQRCISESEPELGLGIINKIESKLITVFFPAAAGARTYGMSTAPLRRIKFDIGAELTLATDEVMKIESLCEQDGLIYYQGNGRSVVETDIISSNSFNRPEERFLIGKFDSNSFFNLRYEVLDNKRRITHSPVRGLLGGRLSRIPHQLYIAQQALKMPHPRVLLADEVGLGKTIEAGLIIHKLLITERAERVLIVVPDSLVYQWFVEMLRKFKQSFVVINQETYLEKNSLPFKENNLVITSIGLLKGAELARNMALDCSWDVLVVDEAHQLKWSDQGPEGESLEYKIVANLSAKTPSVLLLTATPEQLGEEGHFARLRLLDPQRFSSLSQYLEDSANFGKVGALLKRAQRTLDTGAPLLDDDRKMLQELNGEDINFNLQESFRTAINSIIDRHGTGRVYFRNSRVKMAHEFKFFPQRFTHPYPLALLTDNGKSEKLEGYSEEQNLGPVFKARVLWLVEFLQQYKTQKILLICHSKERVLALDKKLRELTTGLNWGMFHSDLSLMARDRQAAYFSEPDGARILLCTEIGSEGRNFAFCQHLVLFDIPRNPDLLEQRIGRLDRIGQTGDIHIHVPFIAGTWEEILFRWYQEGLDALKHYARTGRHVFEVLRPELLEAFSHPKKFTTEHSPEFAALVKKTISVKQEVESKLDLGHDYLVEQNSFNHEMASQLVALIEKNEGGEELRTFMEKVFDHLGVDIEDLNANSFYIRPGDNMFIPYFPGLPQDGVTVTYTREKALEREDYEFLTWDHPMVTGIIDLLLGHNFGSVALAARPNAGQSKAYFEAVFVLEATAPKEFEIERFLPPTPIRILINSSGEDLTFKWPKQVIDQKIVESNQEQKKASPRIGKEKLNSWSELAHKLAIDLASAPKKNAVALAQHEYNLEITRAKTLLALNSESAKKSILDYQQRLSMIEKYLDVATLRMDSFRVIL